MFLIRIFPIVSLLILVLLSGCGIESHLNNSNDPDTSYAYVPNSVPLSFEKIDTPRPLSLSIQDMDIQEIITSKTIDEYVINIYIKPNDSENVYASLSSDSATYEIGVVGYPVHDLDMFGIEQVEVLSHKAIKVSGFCGANCPITYYIDMDTEQPTLLLEVDAHTMEADLDEDGIHEIVATVGTAADTTIYALINNEITLSNLNLPLKAQTVMYDSTSNTFTVYIDQEKLNFIYANRSLVSVVALPATPDTH